MNILELWTHTTKLIPWIEANQGLVSVLSIGAAWFMALRQQKAALDVEARSNERSRLAKEEGAREERQAEVNRKLSALGDFATAVRGVVLDIAQELQRDLNDIKPMLHGQHIVMPISVDLRVAVRAAAETLAALVASTNLSPAMIRAIRSAISIMYQIDYAKPIGTEQYELIFDTWRAALLKAIDEISDAERAILHEFRPMAYAVELPTENVQF